MTRVKMKKHLTHLFSPDKDKDITNLERKCHEVSSCTTERNLKEIIMEQSRTDHKDLGVIKNMEKGNKLRNISNFLAFCTKRYF